MLSKRGYGHVEFVISIVLFLSFVSVALIFFTPETNKLDKQDITEFSIGQLEKQANSEVTKFGVKISSEDVGDGDIAVEIDMVDFGSIVEDGSGKKIGSGSFGNLVVFDPGLKSFVYILAGKDIERKTAVDVPELAEYNITSRIKEKIVIDGKIDELIERYESDYDGLKGEIGIPPNLEFGFKFYIGDEEKGVSKNVFENGDVFVNRKNIRAINSEGLVYGELEIRIW